MTETTLAEHLYPCGSERIRVVPDTDYQSEGSYAYDSEEETQAAVQAEEQAIASGELAPFVILHEYARAIETHHGPALGWEIHDALGGVVTTSPEEALRLYLANEI